MVHISKDLVAASSTPLLLAILTEGDSYGYAILKRVRDVSDGELRWTDGMLYPLLHRLHRLGYVTQEWRLSPEGRRRRYYAITEGGEAALVEHKRQWAAVTRVFDDVGSGEDLSSFTSTRRSRRRSSTGADATRPALREHTRDGAALVRALRDLWRGDSPGHTFGAA